MKTQKTSLVAYAILSFILFTSCQSNVSDPGTNEPSGIPIAEDVTKMKQQLIDEGFPEDLIVTREESFLIDGDIVIPFSHFVEPKNPDPVVSQAHDNRFVSAPNQSNITIGVTNLLVEIEWDRSIDNAITKWNQMGSSVTFTRVYTGNPVDSDIDITFLNLNSPGLVAIATFPNPNTGMPGPLIQVNTGFSNHTLTESMKLYAMLHEIGHTVGLRHTNWQSEGEFPGATTISCTPNGDSNSIMNGGITNNETTEFSFYDNVAAHVLYPVSLSTPVIGGSSQTFTDKAIVDLTLSFNPWRVGVATVEAKKDNGSWTVVDQPNAILGTSTVTVPDDLFIPSFENTSGTYSFRTKQTVCSSTGQVSSYSNPISFIFSFSAGCPPGMPCGGGGF